MNVLVETPVTIILIVANIAASLYAFANRDFFEDNVFFVGPMQAGQWYRGLTSGFLHANQTHLFLNLFVLFQFGPPLERALGSGAYAALYLSALIGGSGWALLDNWKKPNYRAVGASGAISGVIAGYCLFFPTSTLLLFFVIPMPAMLILILLLAGSAYFSTRENTIIGHEAHFGGALVGAITALAVRPEAWGEFTSAISTFLGAG